MTLMQRVSQILEGQMAEVGMSRSDMARELGVSRVVVTQALNDPQRDWKLSTLDEWANALNCEIEVSLRKRADESQEY